MTRYLIITLTILFATAIFHFSSPYMKIAQPKANTAPKTIETLTLKGSNTVGEDFAPLLAEAFLRDQGAILINQHSSSNSLVKQIEGILPEQNKMIKIIIEAHGSSTGFEALASQSTNIAMSSRMIKITEKNTLSQHYGQIEEHPIALDALAIITYPENPLEQLTINQIAQVYSGEIDNWQQLGGDDYPIKLFSRDNNSGTWDTFKNLVLKPHNKKLSITSERLESSNHLVQGVINNSGAIGFVGVTYTGNAKLLRVSNQQKQPPQKPNLFTIGTQNYPLSRKLYFYTAGNQTSQIAKDFIEFTTNNNGQKLTRQVGLVSYYPTRNRPEYIDKESPLRYRELAGLGTRLTVDFSISTSTVDAAKEERDIERLSSYIKQNPQRKIVLVDFSHSHRTQQIRQLLNQNKLTVLDSLQLNYQKWQGKNIEVWVI